MTNDPATAANETRRPEAGAPAPRGGEAYHFGRFVLDLDRACLGDEHRGGAEARLRPKSFDLLRHLVVNAGRVVPRDELMEAVWPGVFVTDDSITQCIKEIRRALGDEAQCLVRTVPKRGYIFAAEVVRDASAASVAQWAARPPDPPPVLPASPALARAERRSSGPPVTLPLSQDTESGADAAGRLVPEAEVPRFPLAADTAPPSRWPDHVVVASRPRRRMHLAAASVLALALALAAVTLPWGGAPPARTTAVTAEEPASARERAQRLAHKGLKLAQREAGPAAWLTQRALYEQAAAADPTYAPAWIGMVFAHMNLIENGHSLNPAEDLRAAERAAERGLALSPAAPAAHAARGSVLRLRPDRLEEALAAFSRALALDSSHHPSRANIGRVLILLGRAEEAEPHLQTALAAAPPDHPFQGGWSFQLGLVDLLLGRGDHGAQYFRRALCPTTIAHCEIQVLHLSAALALGGQVEEARRLVAEVRLRRPEVSAAMLRGQRRQSHHPTYLAQRERLLEGLALAGLP